MTHTPQDGRANNSANIADGLLALADACEAAPLPDCELDFRIASLFDAKVIADLALFADLGERGISVVRRNTPYLAYTASLDAAMTLVDHYGVLLHLSDIGADGLPLCSIGDSATAREFKGFGTANLALAICAAALRACAHLQEKANG